SALTPDRQMQPRRVPARKNGRSSGRADWHRISLRETHAFPRQLIQIGRLVKIRPVASQIPPAKVIGEDENYIQRAGCSHSGIGPQQNQDRQKIRPELGLLPQSWYEAMAWCNTTNPLPSLRRCTKSFFASSVIGCHMSYRTNTSYCLAASALSRA